MLRVPGGTRSGDRADVDVGARSACLLPVVAAIDRTQIERLTRLARPAALDRDADRLRGLVEAGS